MNEFIDLCSKEIPIKKGLEINFSIKEVQDINQEEEIRHSFRNYYEYHLETEKRIIRNRILNAVLLTFISGVLIVTNIFLSRYSINLPDLLFKVLKEGISIGSWVFMWEAVHILSFQILKNIRRKKELKRFISAKISFN